MITSVILCGGSGTRLWPVSRKSFPKQFVPLVGDKSLFQLTLERVAELKGEVIAVAAEDHRFLVSNVMQTALGMSRVVLEPVARNTAAAMACAAILAREAGSNEDLLLFCPADHHIPDTDAFTETVQQGIPIADSGAIVTFGIVPNMPSTAYGYIEYEATEKLHSQVTRFIEKPNLKEAQSLILKGNVLWNAGIFLARIDTIINAIERHAPDILQACQAAIRLSNSETTTSGEVFIRPEAGAFAACRSQSIDYAVMEFHDNIAVVPFKGQWSDVGSWGAIADLTPPDAQGNRIDGQGLAYQSANTYIYARHRPVVALGIENLLIIDTVDAVLIAHRDNSEQVRDVVEKLEDGRFSQAATHRKVNRPWGWYDSIDAGERFQVKRIGVKPGASLSLQKHHHRAEHWIVVKGTAEVTRGHERFLLSENQSTYIPIGEVHRLKNPGKVDLEMIEVQSGGYLGEDDIVRLEDGYGRVNSDAR